MMSRTRSAISILDPLAHTSPIGCGTQLDYKNLRLIKTFINLPTNVRVLMITSIYDVRACPECAGSSLSYLDDRDQVVCRDCGLVYEPLTPRDERRLERVSQALKKTGRATPSKSKHSKAKKKPAPKNEVL